MTGRAPEQNHTNPSRRLISPEHMTVSAAWSVLGPAELNANCSTSTRSRMRIGHNIRGIQQTNCRRQNDGCSQPGVNQVHTHAAAPMGEPGVRWKGGYKTSASPLAGLGTTYLCHFGDGARQWLSSRLIHRWKTLNSSSMQPSSSVGIGRRWRSQIYH